MPISAFQLQARAQHRWRQGIYVALRLEFENGLKRNIKTEFTPVLAKYWAEATQFLSVFQQFLIHLAKVGSPAVSNSPSLSDSPEFFLPKSNNFTVSMRCCAIKSRIEPRCSIMKNWWCAATHRAG